METKTFEIAYRRAKEGKASKAELQVLLSWAKTEIKEWQGFKKLLESKINEQRRTAKN